MHLFGDAAAILNSIISYSYYGHPIAEKVHSPHLSPGIVWKNFNHMLSSRLVCFHVRLNLNSSFEYKLFDIQMLFAKKTTNV